MDAEPGPGRALVGTHQDLIGGHEAKSLLIADSERIAHCGPSLIAPTLRGWLLRVSAMQIGQIWICPFQRDALLCAATPAVSAFSRGARHYAARRGGGSAGPGSPSGGEAEDGVKGGFEGTGVALDLGEEETALERGEEGDSEVVRVGAVQWMPGVVKAA